MGLLTKDGRIPKNKWILISHGRIISRHAFKSVAMDRALIKASVTGRTYIVGEIRFGAYGKPAAYEVFVADRNSFSER